MALLSGWLREHWGATLSPGDIPPILALRMPAVGEKADRVLLHYARAFPCAGDTLESLGAPGVGQDLSEHFLGRNAPSVPALAASGYCESYEESAYLIKTYLTDHKGFLEYGGQGIFPRTITPAGWTRIHELQQVHGAGTVGFIAMWFGQVVKPVSEAIHRAIAAAGYDPVRIDRVEHNNPIDDEIIARIRGSRFLVADLTGQRGGVYFEAGFALGLGLPVIWLCREAELTSIHFDNRQYNFILWNSDALDELERRLKHRIEATLGHGPRV